MNRFFIGVGKLYEEIRYAWSNGEILFFSFSATVSIMSPGYTFEPFFTYDYTCNQTVMENGTLVKVDCKPDYTYVDTFYVPGKPEEATFECVTNRTSLIVSLINVYVDS